MDLPNPGTLESAIADLKEIVSRNQCADTESIEAIDQLELIIANLERKYGAAPVNAERFVAVQPIAATTALV